MGWINIVAKFDSVCVVCNDPVNTGDDIWWLKGTRVVSHIKCGPQVGKTFSSYCFRLSKLLWKKAVRERFSEVVGYVDGNVSDDVGYDLKQYRRYSGDLAKVTKELLEIKKEYPKVVEQLANASNTMQNINDIQCIVFKHSERPWHWRQDGETVTKLASSFVLLLPKYSRVVSFESSQQGVEHEQFGWVSLTNVQLQPAFGRLQANAHRNMVQTGKPASFTDLRFIFRTIRDARTIHEGMRLDNFSFASTGEADAAAFKVANYFVLVGKIASRLEPIRDKDGNIDFDVPANVKHITIFDNTDTRTFRINYTEATKANEAMGSTIEEFFSTGEVGDRLEGRPYVMAIVRWAWGDNEPEILYMKNIGEIKPDDKEKQSRLRRFYLLAYMNTRKNVDLTSLHDSFHDLTDDELNDEYILDGRRSNPVLGENAYFLQYGWEKGNIAYTLDRGKREGSFDWLTDSYTIGPFFKPNPVASALYLSDKPEGTFNKIYDTSFTIGDSAWPLVVKEGAYVYVGGKEVSVYVYSVKFALEKSDTTRILARGGKIPKAYDIANDVCKDPKYELVDTIGSSSRVIAENGQPETISSITIVMRKKQT